MENRKKKVFYLRSQGHEKICKYTGFLLYNWRVVSANKCTLYIKFHFPHGKKFSSFAGAFAKLREVTISFVMSVRMSTRSQEHLGSH